MKVSHYRMWIYTVNALLILLQLWFMHAFWTLATTKYIHLLPVHEARSLIILVFALFTFQFFACFCGLVGVYFSVRQLIRLYWLLMIPLIVIDTIQAFVWMFTFNNLHADFNEYIGELNEMRLRSNFRSWCNSWDMFQKEHLCCAHNFIANDCWRGPTCAVNARSCTISLLQWLHFHTDYLACILYFLLYPTKLIVVFVLRDDMLELITEIIVTNHKQEYRHWLELDKDELEGLEPASVYETISSKPADSVHSKEGSYNGITI